MCSLYTLSFSNNTSFQSSLMHFSCGLLLTVQGQHVIENTPCRKTMYLFIYKLLESTCFISQYMQIHLYVTHHIVYLFILIIHFSYSFEIFNCYKYYMYFFAFPEFDNYVTSKQTFIVDRKAPTKLVQPQN